MTSRTWLHSEDAVSVVPHFACFDCDVWYACQDSHGPCLISQSNRKSGVYARKIQRNVGTEGAAAGLALAQQEDC